MGKGLSLFSTEDNANDNALIDHHLSDSIYNHISRNKKQVSSGLYDENITYLCMKYIGFIMYSQILNINDQYKSYKIISSHHKSNEIQSPLIQPNHICYIKLLYSFSYKDAYTPNCNTQFNYNFLKYCMDKPNLLIIFYTRQHHVYSIYMREPAKKKRGVFDKDSNMYLLRTLNEKKFRPRVIKTLKAEEPIFDYNEFLNHIRIGNITFFASAANINCSQYEISPAEQFGYPHQDDTLLPDIAFNQIEVFQLL